MELQHKEKMAGDQLSAKEKEILYLQNQIFLRDELIKDPSSHNKGIHSIADIVQDRKKARLASERLRAKEVGASPKRFESPKDFTHLPKLKVRSSLNQLNDRRKSYSKKRIKDNQNSLDEGHLLLLNRKVNNAQPQYYFKKHEWRKSVAQDAVLPKLKRNRYGHPLHRNSEHSRSMKRQNSLGGLQKIHNKNAKGVRSIELTPRRTSVTLSERSFVSTDTATSSDKLNFKGRMISGRNGNHGGISLKKLPAGKFLPQLKYKYNSNNILKKNIHMFKERTWAGMGV